jgi:hypothetical protein
VPKKKRPARTTKLEEYRLRGKRKGAVLKEQTWLENGKIVAYSLAYINLNRCSVDNGRVLGYDNRHGYHHRHCMGKIEPIVFSHYESLARRFYKEVRELWRKEDEEG